MARQLRIEFEGATHHLLNPGDHREDIFGDDAEWQVCASVLGSPRCEPRARRARALSRQIAAVTLRQREKVKMCQCVGLTHL